VQCKNNHFLLNNNKKTTYKQTATDAYHNDVEIYKKQAFAIVYFEQEVVVII